MSYALAINYLTRLIQRLGGIPIPWGAVLFSFRHMWIYSSVLIKGVFKRLLFFLSYFNNIPRTSIRSALEHPVGGLTLNIEETRKLIAINIYSEFNGRGERTSSEGDGRQRPLRGDIISWIEDIRPPGYGFLLEWDRTSPSKVAACGEISAKAIIRAEYQVC